MPALKKAMEEILRIQRNGDEIKDFVLLRYGFLSDEVEKTYRDIQRRVEQHVDEFVLVYSAWNRHEGCTGFGGKGYYVRQHNLYLAVLKDGQLILDDPAKGLVFPTEVYAISG